MTGIFCVDGKPIPCEYVTHGEARERYARIVIMRIGEIEIETDGPFTNKNIVLTGSTIVCETHKKPVWGPFLGQMEGEIGKDIVPATTGINRFVWKSPPKALFDYQKPGDEITFFEF